MQQQYRSEWFHSEFHLNVSGFEKKRTRNEYSENDRENLG
jgi:hypothetical protein